MSSTPAVLTGIGSEFTMNSGHNFTHYPTVNPLHLFCVCNNHVYMLKYIKIGLKMLMTLQITNNKAFLAQLHGQTAYKVSTKMLSWAKKALLFATSLKTTF